MKTNTKLLIIQQSIQNELSGQRKKYKKVNDKRMKHVEQISEEVIRAMDRTIFLENWINLLQILEKSGQ